MRDATVSDFFTKNPNLKKIKKFFVFFDVGGRWWVRGAIVREFL